VTSENNSTEQYSNLTGISGTYKILAFTNVVFSPPVSAINNIYTLNEKIYIKEKHQVTHILSLEDLKHHLMKFSSNTSLGN
jgi:hypothetical protein